MFYAIILLNYPGESTNGVNLFEGDKPSLDELILEDIKEAHKTLKKFKGSRMKTFESREKAIDFLENPDKDGSFMESFVEEQPSKSESDFLDSFEKLSISNSNNKDKNDSQTISTSIIEVEKFPTPQPSFFTQLRKKIETGDYEGVEQTIWENPRCLVTVCDTATYLMAGPKYNACHIAARSNKPDIMALILDTISNLKFVKKLYQDESDENLEVRINHLLDSYLNTPEPRQGNTPLHFACKKGFYKVVRVILTFEGCDLKIKDSNGHTAEESIFEQVTITNEEEGGGGGGGDTSLAIKQKLKNLFKMQLHLPLHRDQLKKRLLLARRRHSGNFNDSDASFSEDSFLFSPI